MTKVHLLQPKMENQAIPKGTNSRVALRSVLSSLGQPQQKEFTSYATGYVPSQLDTDRQP